MILGIAVLLDAALVRLLLVPVLLRLHGQMGVVAAQAPGPDPARRPLRPRLKRRRDPRVSAARHLLLHPLAHRCPGRALRSPPPPRKSSPPPAPPS